ncbi:hypothetical protein BS47DRAFT_1338898 [Hydnum rufescens UP504]|uniref:Ceramide very long chain fatty acid hydroxylase n=1 Tax=Hydnum rufescens UP504 TaxID=1448309 RepID=A0A9P6B645_9AGAM|nr:hypothetical protein BS47DRAFT_1338898 [Hydnum rufescens UP504]
MSTVKTKLRIFSSIDVEKHASRKECWISRNGRVYDVTAFVPDHPGGEDLILRYAGKDIGNAMADASEHDHSQAAYDMLHEYLIGKIGSQSTVVSEGMISTPDETMPEDDFVKHEFLDLTKPLLRQLWESNFSKEFYLQQVHQPRHVTKTARLFGPDYLEVFTRTEWYVVPLFWGPITSVLFLRSALQFSGLAPHSVFHASSLAIASIPASSFAKTGVCFIIGNIIWTLLEYFLHRFLFHIDARLPDHPLSLVLHFLLHGIHHYLPMDGLRLVMPPAIVLPHVVFPTAIANGIISGAFAFYVLYDCMHYALHHTRLPAYIREQKKYHLSHHYKNFELGFGVTSKIWDYVFGTVLRV